MQTDSFFPQDLVSVYTSEEKSRLTFKKIVDIIDDYRAQHDGYFPSNKTRQFADIGFPEIDSWNALNNTIRSGAHGLDTDPEYQEWRRAQKAAHGRVALSGLLDQHYQSERMPTLDVVRQLIDTYRAENDGKFPTAMIKQPIDGTWNGLDTWQSVNLTLDQGRNGIFDDPKYRELEKEFAAIGKKVTLSSVMDSWYPERLSHDKVLTLSKLRTYVDAYRTSTGGDFPSTRSTGAVSWASIDNSLSGGFQGLKNDPEFQDMQAKLAVEGLKPSLSTTLDFLYPEERLLSLKNNKGWIAEHRLKNHGDAPTKASTDLVEGRTWGALDKALINGYGGLARDPEYQALVRTGATCTLSSLSMEFLSPSQIKAKVDRYRNEHDGQFPYATATGVTKWGVIDHMLRSELPAGLDDPEWTSLKRRMAKQPHPPSLQGALDVWYPEERILTVAKVVDWLRDFAAAHDGKLPSTTEKSLVAGRTWKELDRSIMLGSHGLDRDPKYQEIISIHGAMTLAKLKTVLQKTASIQNDGFEKIVYPTAKPASPKAVPDAEAIGRAERAIQFLQPGNDRPKRIQATKPH